MIFLTEQDHISTKENYNERVIKQSQWSKISRQLRATVHGTCRKKQNTKQL